MEDKAVTDAADAWIAYQKGVRESGEAFRTSPTAAALWPKYSQLLDWTYHDPELTWGTIVAIWNRINQDDLEALADLGAGEVEDLLNNFGEDYFPVIEKFCGVEPDFKTVLRMVWKSSMSPELWQKVQDLRGGPNL